MNEDIVIKREWVKKIGIIFFVIILGLTFFSKTIMNTSLPKVSIQSIKAGQMNLNIMGSGTAYSVSTYEVMLNSTRTISEVLVQQGDKISEGDVLFTLKDEDSKELDLELDTLDDLNLRYQKMLLNQTENSYQAEDRAISRAEAELAEAMKKLEENKVSNQESVTIENEYKLLNSEVKDIESEIAILQEKLSNYAGATDEAMLALKRQIEDKKRQINNAYDNDTPNPISLESLELELERLEEDLRIAQQGVVDESRIRSLENEIEDKQREIENYSPYIEGPSVDVEQLEIELKRLEDDYEKLKEKNKLYDEISEKINFKKNTLQQTKSDFESVQSKHETLKEKKDIWEVADKEVETLQNNREDLLFNLEEKKRAYEKSSAIENLDLGKIRKDIAEQNEEIKKLRAETENRKIIAQKSGILKSISVSAGGLTSPGTAIAVIETSEKGYGVDFTVTKEQAAKLTIGDEAKTDNSKVKATLSQVKLDPNGSKDERILTFMLDGEVISGEEYAVTLNKNGKKYDTVIPLSALHSDSEGYFVLTVATKGAPFGERHSVKRIAIEVLDRDDENAAIKGSISDTDYVITFSSKLINDGTQIRVTGNQ